MPELRYLTAGESHGPCLTAVVEGLPAGVPVTEDYVNLQLARRQGGYGRGKRMSIESDRARFVGGVRGGVTIGSPVALLVENRDWVNWSGVMAPGPEARLDEKTVTRPRPGHADLGGALKYGHSDIRNVLERASARETASRVAACTLGRRLLEELGVEIFGMVLSVGPIEAAVPDRTLDELKARVEISPVMCPDPIASSRIVEAIDRARDQGDTLGGIFEIRALGVVPGLGSYVHWDRKLDGRLAAALMSIQAVKAVEIGAGFAAARNFGSAVQDEICYDASRGFYRSSNRAGGIEGGVTNGEPIVVRGAMKPIPTLGQPLQSVDLRSKETVRAAYERSDVCAVPAACVIAEAVVAWELARTYLEKFGGDTLDDLKQSVAAYLERIREA